MSELEIQQLKEYKKYFFILFRRRHSGLIAVAMFLIASMWKQEK